ncbi:hypothetical protein B9Z55_004359 [Caenorhabditis nigoni]|nr:hypothetical protein B9Z55_004359 [Caenorhabditis nigoni]
MSKFLEVPSIATTKNSFQVAASYYLIEKFRPIFCYVLPDAQDPLEGKEKELIQLMIDNSNHWLRMYGSAEELLENINIYKDFSRSHELVSLSKETYPFRPRIFKSFQNEKYIAKSDLFVILQNMMIEVATPEPFEITRMLAVYLKSREKSAGFKSIEFVKFDEAIFEKMRERMKVEIGEKPVLSVPRMSMEASLEKLRRNIPLTLDNSQKENFDNFLGIFFCISDREAEIPPINTLVTYFLDYKRFTKALGTIIDENPDMFSPRGEDSDEPLTLRVFEDGDQKFLMKEEIFKPTEFDFFRNPNTIPLDTITMKELLESGEIRNVEFIRYPITRAKHRATPIRGPAGGLFILAIDCFFEYLRNLIHGEQILQKLKPTDLPKFLQKLNECDEFNCREENPYFIQTDRPRAITYMDNLHDYLHGLKWQDILKRPAKKVRNVEPSGFTVQDLKNELEHLGLTTIFPEIQDYAEAVYSEVEKHKKERFLRTCDVFDAIEHCQLNCVLERLPKLKKFVHNQKGCHRVHGMKCEKCDAEKPENEKDQKLKILEKELADLKIAHQKILEENQELQQKLLRLSVKNETNEVQIKQPAEKLTQSKLSIDDVNYSNACTSQQNVQCLICEKSMESGVDQIIRCPLCKRRFYEKCAINWIKDHQQCPVCNGDLPIF